jgi:LL-diaminopimelate aminotransferase
VHFNDSSEDTMNICASKRVQSIGVYAFAEVDRQVAVLREQGINPIDFGVGDPTNPTPSFIIEALHEAAITRASSGYPSYAGAPEYRSAVAAWFERRFGVKLDPGTEISATIGSKEAVFNFHEGFVNPGDYVIIPSPGYPPYTRGTLFAEGKPYHIPILEKNGFLPDLDAIPKDVLAKARLMWINYPNSPTGKIAPPEFLKRVAEFGQKHEIIIASDEAYTEMYFKEKPHSILEYARDGVVAFHSLSKRSAMTCWRVGFAAGDRRIIDIFKKVKMNIDSGTATFIQDAASAALGDEKHVDEMRREYHTKRDIMVDAFKAAGLPECAPEATIYIWQKCPKGMNSVEFAKALLVPEIAVVTTPGAWLGDRMPDGSNPGEGYIRLALVPTIEETKKAAGRIRKMKF